ncbi:snRNA-activating protein complex subunit 1 [Hetaerina americana]|uniref:snRNA-activating protein complex subunit 1 n=1 Tax=Hetaerina americana TaxID=62018 RepID=UPI003A7F5557
MSLGGSYIAAGVRADCEKLLSEFIAKNSLRFDDFVEVWQKMSFSLIYCGRKTFSELVEFTEEVLQITKTFMFPPHSLQMRAGGVYLSAGLYYKQPTSGLVKIRITYEDLEHLNPFLEQLREEGHYDVLYMFSKMLAENALLFTLSPRTYGIEYNIRKYLLHKPGDDNLNSMKDEESSDEEDFSPETFALDFLKKSKLLEQVQDIETRYQTMKTLLYGDQNGKLPKSLSFTAPSLLEAMNAAIGGGKPSTNLEESSKRKLKKDAFKRQNKTEITKALERNVSSQETETDSEDNLPSTSKKATKGERSGRRKREQGFPAEEWAATSHPKNRHQNRTTRAFALKSESCQPSSVEIQNEPSCSTVEASDTLSLQEI